MSKEELEEVENLLNDADKKLEEAAKIFCRILHDKDGCYNECPAKVNGEFRCYIYEAFTSIEPMIEKIELLKKRMKGVRA